MKKYKIIVISNFNTKKFFSTSRNAKKHLQENGGFIAIVYDKNGRAVSQSVRDEKGKIRNVIPSGI